MAEYIDLPIETDPQDVLNDFITYIQSLVPGWTPGAGNLDSWLANAIALAAAETRDVASAVPKSIFRYFGATLVNYPPIDDVSATVLTDWTVIDAAGYTIPAGTQVSISKTGDETFAFQTTEDAVIAPGDTTVLGVQVVAMIPGADSSGVGAPGGTVDLVDPLAFVSAITQQAATAGGADAEDDDTYLNRLASYLQTIAPRPILPNDFVVFAKAIPGVARVVAIDGYNTADATFNNPRMITLVGIDSSGAALDGTHKSEVQADAEARREVNFVVNMADPTLSNIDVTVQVKALAGFDPGVLQTSIEAAITDYLSPAAWGSVDGDPTQWNNVTTVRYLEMAQVINAVPGVDYITTTGGNYDLLISIHPAAGARADLALAGIAPLPVADVLTVTVT
jgi:hypothetical protein